MIRLRLQHNWGVRKRVLFLATVPMVLVSILIGFYLTRAHLDYMRRTMEQHGQEIARNLGFAGEFSLLIDDRQRLQSIVDRALLGPEIAGVAILDRQGEVVASRGVSEAGGDLQGLQVYRFEVVANPLDQQESEELRGSGEIQHLGRVLVYVSPDHLRQAAREVVIRSVMFILFGLLFASLLALLLARELLAPIQRIIELVGRVQEGDLSSRLARKSGAEFGELEQGINRMVRTIEGSQQELEARVQMATAALQKTVAELREQGVALEASRREAVEAGQARERFLALVSHELRTQLNAIVGFAELLQQVRGERESREYVRIIHNASRQLLAIIDDVLSYSGLNAGTLQVKNRAFDPVSVLEDVVSLLSPDAHGKGLELVLLVHRDTPRQVIGDPVRFSQVVTNLLINAIKFTERGEILVVSESAPVAGDAHRACLKVSVDDSGIGIRDEIRDSLFEPFVQGDSAIGKRYGGTGLGLAISRSLMERMGGRIELADSTLGGSRFCITLPAAEAGEKVADDPLHNRLSGYKALVADSHAVSRRAVKNTLLHFGMEVYQQPRGMTVEAVLLRAVRDGEPFDVLIVGGRADEFSAERMAQLRRCQQRTGTRIVVLISDESRIHEKEAMLEGAPCVVVSSKPIRRHRLLENLQRVMACERVEADTPEAASETAPAAESGLRALIADDNAFSRQLLAVSLRRLGIAVEACEEGAGVVEKARQRHYDIVFLDINMPGMDGLSAARRIREQTGYRTTPLVAVTADLFTSEIRSQRHDLFDETLFKPISQRDVEAVVQRLLAVETVTAEGEEGGDDPWQPARFRAALEGQLEALRAAQASGDRARLREVVHQINGLTGYFGVAEITERARALEERAAKAEDGEIATLVEALFTAVERL